MKSTVTRSTRPFDHEENRWKAVQFGNIKSDGPWYEAVFHARLAEKLEAAGLGIRRTDRNFELASVSRELVEKFSKRTMQIERLARDNFTKVDARARALMKETGLDYADAYAKVKHDLGAESREKKYGNAWPRRATGRLACANDPGGVGIAHSWVSQDGLVTGLNPRG